MLTENIMYPTTFTTSLFQEWLRNHTCKWKELDGSKPEVNLIKFYKLQVQLLFSDSKAWFKHQTRHEPDLIH